MFFFNQNIILNIDIKLIWGKTKHLFCSWHRYSNFKKRFFFLNKIDKKLYNLIAYLPYEISINKFNEKYDDINNNENIKEEDKTYLDFYHQKRESWCKAHIINNYYFTCGVSTTQRIESINAKLKKLDNKSSLQELLQFTKSHELKLNHDMVDEKKSIMNKKEYNGCENIKLISYFKSIVGHYILTKIKEQFFLSLNYNVFELETIENDHYWYLIEFYQNL